MILHPQRLPPPLSAKLPCRPRCGISHFLHDITFVCGGAEIGIYFYVASAPQRVRLLYVVKGETRLRSWIIMIYGPAERREREWGWQKGVSGWHHHHSGAWENEPTSTEAAKVPPSKKKTHHFLPWRNNHGHPWGAYVRAQSLLHCPCSLIY